MAMKNYFSLLLMSALLASCVNFSGVESSPVTYPESRYDSSDVKTTIGHDVADPYGWMEDDRSEETAEWVEAQNEVTFAHLEEIPFRAALRDRLSALWNYAKRGAPFIEGDYRYHYRNDGLQNQYVIYRVPVAGGDEDAVVFLDPNTFSEDGTTSLGGVSFSPDGSLVAYQISEGGSDWRKVIVLDAVTGNRLGDTLVDIKFSGLAWLGNAGFYYSSYEKPEEGSALSGMTDVHRLFYHRLGDAQIEDELIFGGEDLPRRYVQGQVTDDGDWLVVTAAVSTTGNELYVQDLRDADGALALIAEGFDKAYGVVTSRDGKLYIQTNDGAPNNRLMVSHGIAVGVDAWEEVIAEREFPISFTMGSGYLFVKSLEHALTTVDQYHLTGALIRRVELPGVGTAGGFGGKHDADVLYYNFTNAITPSTIYAYDAERGESSVFHASEIDFDPSGFVSSQIFYTSPDGTVIPMTISHKKGLALDGSNPTMLYGYGGFNISLKPSFSTSYTVWMEQGGILAIPNIRGGGEYGEAWHVAGTKMQKQNVFDDFIAAADYLIDNGYTSHERLALAGGSNGGLLVGAVITQRPELAAVAFPAVGVLDMLRYHTFTAGAGWAYDYGTAEDSDEMFNYLLGYSPVHNVTAGTCYPATMVTTADHDDRVVPSHSFKFAAELQAKQSCSNPTLIRIETNAGHGAGKPTAMVIEEAIDKFAFAFWHMGITELK